MFEILKKDFIWCSCGLKCVHIYHLGKSMLAAFRIPLTKAVFVDGGLMLVK